MCGWIPLSYRFDSLAFLKPMNQWYKIVHASLFVMFIKTDCPGEINARLTILPHLQFVIWATYTLYMYRFRMCVNYDSWRLLLLLYIICIHEVHPMYDSLSARLKHIKISARKNFFFSKNSKCSCSYFIFHFCPHRRYVSDLRPSCYISNTRE